MLWAYGSDHADRATERPPGGSSAGGPSQARAGNPMLVATLVNALAHHGRRVEPDVAAEHLQNLNQGESQRWLREQIDRITAELG
jgi:hypothetical protein